MEGIGGKMRGGGPEGGKLVVPREKGWIEREEGNYAGRERMRWFPDGCIGS